MKAEELLERYAAGERKFAGADLRGADLRYANLRVADLRGADLRHANLQDANLRSVKNFTLLPVQDARGYSFTHAINTDDGWRVRAGCRDFSISEALEHWSDPDHEDPLIAQQYVYAVKWLAAWVGLVDAMRP